MKTEQICKHCGGDVRIRNPSGYCDHLYYPDYCKTCKKNLKGVRKVQKSIPNGAKDCTQRCQIIDLDGKRCKSLAKYTIQYHGDNEIYSCLDKNPRTWAEIKVCKVHNDQK